VRLSPETCRVKPLRRIKTQLLHLVGLISLLYDQVIFHINCSYVRLSIADFITVLMRVCVIVQGAEVIIFLIMKE